MVSESKQRSKDSDGIHCQYRPFSKLNYTWAKYADETINNREKFIRT